jgi:MoaA/NifB/PqqE/SkfB family radical SAM enzyme
MSINDLILLRNLVYLNIEKMSYNKNTTCILPWISLDRNADSSNPSFSPCCLYTHQKEEKHSFEEYWHSAELSKIRKEMRNGIRPKGCWKCWTDEDAQKKSMRQSVNESRLLPHQDLILKEDNELNPIQVKLLSGASCNLSCRMCQSHVSSKVYKVWESIGMPTKEPYQYDHLSEEIIRKYASSIRYIDLMGGEPFYHKKIQSLIDWLVVENHSSHITIYVTTNGMLLNDSLISNLKKFEDVIIIVSLDAVGKKHEYIRPGANWDIISSNIDKLRKNKLNVIVQPTISAINILCLPELFEWCAEKKLHMTQMCLVHDPEQLHPKNLPEQLKPLVDKRFSSFIQEEMSESSLDFIKKLDKYWNTKIYDYIPEWKDVYINSKNINILEKDYELYRRTMEYIKKI